MQARRVERDLDDRILRDSDRGRRQRLHERSPDLEVDDSLAPEGLGDVDGGVEGVVPRCVDADVLRPDAEQAVSALGQPLAQSQPARLQLHLEEIVFQLQPAVAWTDCARDEVHRRAADHGRDEAVHGPVVDVSGVSTCWTTPSRSTATRSGMLIASTWSCVT